MSKRITTKILYIALMVISILVAVKLLFVGYCHDEEYQIVMAYRRLMGDRLFGTMWEPHQTSSFINYVFMWVYIKLTGTTTGIVLYLRAVGILIHTAISVFVYFSIKSIDVFKNKNKLAFLIAVIYFNTSVGLFASAEYSNILYWASTLMIIFMYKAFGQNTAGKKQKLMLCLASLSLCLLVLAFPPMILFAPVALIFVIILSDKKYLDALIFTGTSLVFGLIYSMFHIGSVGLKTFISTIPRIVSSDNTHHVTENNYWLSKIPSAIESVWLYLVIAVVATVVGVAVSMIVLRQNKAKRELAILVSFIVSFVATICFWLIKNRGFEEGQIFIIVGFFGLIYYALVACKGKNRGIIYFVLALALCNLVVGYMFSNMELSVKLPHMVYVVVVLIIVISASLLRYDTRKLLYVNLIIIFALFAFAKGFMIRSGEDKNNIFYVENICRSGPGVGIVADYMQTHIMDVNNEEWKNIVNDGDTVLIVSKTLHSDVITSYLSKKVNIAHYAVNNPYSYTMTLDKYWDIYPDKKPNLIAIDCWFGQPLIGDDEWIMSYINDNGYRIVADGDYLRYYRLD